MSEGLGQVVSWYVCTIVPVLVLGARLLARWHRFGSISVEDCLLIVAAGCLIGDLAIQHRMWIWGMANIAETDAESFKKIMQMIVPGSSLYVTSLWSIKIALILFYKRLAAPGLKLQTVYNITLGGLVITWLVILFDIIFQCFPEDRRWSSDPDYQCSSKASDINYWITILLNIFSDVLIICLPISMVLKLQMKTKQKLGVIFLFCLGTFTVIASIIRAYYSRLNEIMLTCTVSMVETAIAMIVACLPSLRKLLLGQTSQSGTSENYRRYELSSIHRKNPRSHTTAPAVGGASEANESEDDLLKQGGSYTLGAGSAATSGKDIFLNTTSMMQESVDAEKAKFGDTTFC